MTWLVSPRPPKSENVVIRDVRVAAGCCGRGLEDDGPGCAGLVCATGGLRIAVCGVRWGLPRD
jgi:hypothetical protein